MEDKGTRKPAALNAAKDTARMVRESLAPRKPMRDTRPGWLTLPDISKLSGSIVSQIAAARDPDFFNGLTDMTDVERRCLDNFMRECEASGWGVSYKPISLTPLQTRVVFALGYYLGQVIHAPELKDDALAKVNNPAIEVKSLRGLPILLTPVAELVFGRKSPEFLKRLFDVIKEIEGRGQWQRPIQNPLTNKYAVWWGEPLLRAARLADIGEGADITPIYVTVYFSDHFFLNLNDQFAPLTRKLFKVWRKNSNDCFTNLLCTFLAVYWSKYSAAQSVAWPKKKGAIHRALRYELDVGNLMERTNRDYAAERSYLRQFEDELDRSMRGFMEAGLITEWHIVDKRNRTTAGLSMRNRLKGKKIVVYFSLGYHGQPDQTAAQNPPEPSDMR